MEPGRYVVPQHCQQYPPNYQAGMPFYMRSHQPHFPPYQQVQGQVFQHGGVYNHNPYSGPPLGYQRHAAPPAQAQTGPPMQYMSGPAHMNAQMYRSGPSTPPPPQYSAAAGDGVNPNMYPWSSAVTPPSPGSLHFRNSSAPSARQPQHYPSHPDGTISHENMHTSEAIGTSQANQSSNQVNPGFFNAAMHHGIKIEAAPDNMSPSSTKNQQPAYTETSVNQESSALPDALNSLNFDAKESENLAQSDIPVSSTSVAARIRQSVNSSIPVKNSNISVTAKTSVGFSKFQKKWSAKDKLENVEVKQPARNLTKGHPYGFSPDKKNTEKNYDNLSSKKNQSGTLGRKKNLDTLSTKKENDNLSTKKTQENLSTKKNGAAKADANKRPKSADQDLYEKKIQENCFWIPEDSEVSEDSDCDLFEDPVGTKSRNKPAAQADRSVTEPVSVTTSDSATSHTEYEMSPDDDVDIEEHEYLAYCDELSSSVETSDKGEEMDCSRDSSCSKDTDDFSDDQMKNTDSYDESKEIQVNTECDKDIDESNKSTEIPKSEANLENTREQFIKHYLTQIKTVERSKADMLSNEISLEQFALLLAKEAIAKGVLKFANTVDILPCSNTNKTEAQPNDPCDKEEPNRKRLYSWDSLKKNKDETLAEHSNDTKMKNLCDNSTKCEHVKEINADATETNMTDVVKRDEVDKLKVNAKETVVDDQKPKEMFITPAAKKSEDFENTYFRKRASQHGICIKSPPDRKHRGVASKSADPVASTSESDSNTLNKLAEIEVASYQPRMPLKLRAMSEESDSDSSVRNRRFSEALGMIKRTYTEDFDSDTRSLEGSQGDPVDAFRFKASLCGIKIQIPRHQSESSIDSETELPDRNLKNIDHDMARKATSTPDNLSLTPTLNPESPVFRPVRKKQEPLDWTIPDTEKKQEPLDWTFPDSSQPSSTDTSQILEGSESESTDKSVKSMRADAPEFNPLKTTNKMNVAAPAFSPKVTESTKNNNAKSHIFYLPSVKTSPKKAPSKPTVGVQVSPLMTESSVGTRRVRHKDSGMMTTACDSREVSVNTEKTCDNNMFVKLVSPRAKFATKAVNTTGVKKRSVGINVCFFMDDNRRDRTKEQQNSTLKTTREIRLEERHQLAKKVKALQVELIGYKKREVIDKLQSSIKSLGEHMASLATICTSRADRSVLGSVLLGKKERLTKLLRQVEAVAEKSVAQVKSGWVFNELPDFTSYLEESARSPTSPDPVPWPAEPAYPSPEVRTSPELNCNNSNSTTVPVTHWSLDSQDEATTHMLSPKMMSTLPRKTSPVINRRKKTKTDGGTLHDSLKEMQTLQTAASVKSTVTPEKVDKASTASKGYKRMMDLDDSSSEQDDVDDTQKPADKEALETETTKTLAETNKTKAEISKMQAETNKTKSEISKIQAETNKTEAERNESPVETNFKEFQSVTEDMRKLISDKMIDEYWNAAPEPKLDDKLEKAEQNNAAKLKESIAKMDSIDSEEEDYLCTSHVRNGDCLEKEGVHSGEGEKTTESAVKVAESEQTDDASSTKNLARINDGDEQDSKTESSVSEPQTSISHGEGGAQISDTKAKEACVELEGPNNAHILSEDKQHSKRSADKAKVSQSGEVKTSDSGNETQATVSDEKETISVSDCYDKISKTLEVSVDTTQAECSTNEMDSKIADSDSQASKAELQSKDTSKFGQAKSAVDAATVGAMTKSNLPNPLPDGTSSTEKSNIDSTTADDDKKAPGTDETVPETELDKNKALPDSQNSQDLQDTSNKSTSNDSEDIPKKTSISSKAPTLSNSSETVNMSFKNFRFKPTTAEKHSLKETENTPVLPSSDKQPLQETKNTVMEVSPRKVATGVPMTTPADLPQEVPGLIAPMPDPSASQTQIPRLGAPLTNPTALPQAQAWGRAEGSGTGPGMTDGVDSVLLQAVMTQLIQAYPELAMNQQLLMTVTLQQTQLLQNYINYGGGAGTNDEGFGAAASGLDMGSLLGSSFQFGLPNTLMGSMQPISLTPDATGYQSQEGSGLQVNQSQAEGQDDRIQSGNTKIDENGRQNIGDFSNSEKESLGVTKQVSNQQGKENSQQQSKQKSKPGPPGLNSLDDSIKKASGGADIPKSRDSSLQSIPNTAFQSGDPNDQKEGDQSRLSTSLDDKQFQEATKQEDRSRSKSGGNPPDFLPDFAHRHNPVNSSTRITHSFKKTLDDQVMRSLSNSQQVNFERKTPSPPKVPLPTPSTADSQEEFPSLLKSKSKVSGPPPGLQGNSMLQTKDFHEQMDNNEPNAGSFSQVGNSMPSASTFPQYVNTARPQAGTTPQPVNNTKFSMGTNRQQMSNSNQPTRMFPQQVNSTRPSHLATMPQQQGNNARPQNPTSSAPMNIAPLIRGSQSGQPPQQAQNRGWPAAADRSHMKASQPSLPTKKSPDNLNIIPSENWDDEADPYPTTFSLGMMKKQPSEPDTVRTRPAMSSQKLATRPPPPPPVPSGPSESWDDEVDPYPTTFSLGMMKKRPPDLPAASRPSTGPNSKEQLTRRPVGMAPPNDGDRKSNAKMCDIPAPKLPTPTTPTEPMVKFKAEEVKKEVKQEEEWCQVQSKRKRHASKEAGNEVRSSAAPYTNPGGPGDSQKKSRISNFDRLVGRMILEFPYADRQQIIDAITSIRNLRGSLSGLSMESIIDKAHSFIKTDNPAPKTIPGLPPPQPPKQPPNLPPRQQAKQNVSRPQRPKSITPPPLEGTVPRPPGFQTMPRMSAKPMPEGYTFPPQPVAQDEEICVICHDALSWEPVKKLDCGHVFHSKCISQWVERERTCPTCRQHALFPEEFPRLGK